MNDTVTLLPACDDKNCFFAPTLGCLLDERDNGLQMLTHGSDEEHCLWPVCEAAHGAGNEKKTGPMRPTALLGPEIASHGARVERTTVTRYASSSAYKTHAHG